jgi:nicotinate phosphoribosyltransferase
VKLRTAARTPLSALLVDLYELTMMQAYLEHGIEGRATFDLFVRRLSEERNFLLTAGLVPLLESMESLRFQAGDLEYLESTGLFTAGFLEYLEGFRFSGDVDAMPEGTIAFAGEPILRVTAPVAEAQFFETLIMNQIHVATLLASKAARVVLAAEGRGLVDFGLRRMHGIDAGVAGARACWIAGFDGTSNVLAGRLFGIPVSGTMAHSFVQCHERERLALERFLDSFPESVLLVDTYDTLRGVDTVIGIARSQGDRFRARGLRLDSGDLGELAREARQRLDQAGLQRLQIVASGNLDEWRVRELVRQEAPIDGFGIGTRLGTSEDAPNLDLVYKIAQIGGRPLLKLSPDKATLPGLKQVWRQSDDGGLPVRDVVGIADEPQTGTPLLVEVMRGGQRLDAGRETLDAVRARAACGLACLPSSIRSLETARQRYPVLVSEALQASRARIADELLTGGR